jgi:uncharacterized membrane protein
LHSQLDVLISLARQRFPLSLQPLIRNEHKRRKGYPRVRNSLFFPWSPRLIIMTLDWRIRGTITYASIALDGLLFFLLLGLTITTCMLHRQQRFGPHVLPIKALISSLVVWTLSVENPHDDHTRIHWTNNGVLQS